MRDGGPAFPIANAVYDADAPDSFEQFKAATSRSQGMSLRDYFAAAVLPVLFEGGAGLSDQQLAKDAYGLADAMLTERDRK